MLLANLPCFPLTLNFFFFVVVLFNFVIVVIALDVSERKWAERKTPGEEKGNETNKQMQTLKGEQDEGREGWWGGGWKEGGLLPLFFCFPVPWLCALWWNTLPFADTLFLYFLSVAVFCVLECVCGKARGRDPLSWKVKSGRKISGEELREEGWGDR